MELRCAESKADDRRWLGVMMPQGRGGRPRGATGGGGRSGRFGRDGSAVGPPS